MDSIVPYAVAAIVCFLASVLLLFIYLSRRVGDWIALAAVLPDPLHGHGLRGPPHRVPDQLLRVGCLRHRRAARDRAPRPARRSDRLRAAGRLAGVRRDRAGFRRRRARRDRPSAGPVASLLGHRRPGRSLRALVRRSTKPANPAISPLHNVALSPAYVVDGFASSLGSLFGLGTPILFDGEGGLPWGRPLLVAAIVGATFWLLRTRTPLRALDPCPAGGRARLLAADGGQLPAGAPAHGLPLPVRGRRLRAPDRRRARGGLAAGVASDPGGVRGIHRGGCREPRDTARWLSQPRPLPRRPSAAGSAGSRSPRTTSAPTSSSQAELQLQLLHPGQSRPLPLRFGEVRLARLFARPSWRAPPSRPGKPPTRCWQRPCRSACGRARPARAGRRSAATGRPTDHRSSAQGSCVTVTASRGQPRSSRCRPAARS